MSDTPADTIPDSELCGLSEAHLVPFDDRVCLHRDVIPAVRQLVAMAAEQGMELAVASGFRGFERQCGIWNAKAEGRRPVLDDRGAPLDVATLSERELVFAILRWSALPGASRHHWGTDMDLWDRAAVPADYDLQLTSAEYADDGPFHRLARWLDSPAVTALGFARPYALDRGGVAPEPWHLSFLPVAQRYQRRLSPQCLRSVIAAGPLALKDTVLDNFDLIYARYVALPDTEAPAPGPRPGS